MHLAQNRELSDAYLQWPGKPLVSREDLAFDEVWCISLEVWTRVGSPRAVAESDTVEKP